MARLVGAAVDDGDWSNSMLAKCLLLPRSALVLGLLANGAVMAAPPRRKAHHVIHVVVDVCWCLLFLGLAVTAALGSMTDHSIPLLLLGAAAECCPGASAACKHAARVLLLVLLLLQMACGRHGLSDHQCPGHLLSLQHSSGLQAMRRCRCLCAPTLS